MQELNRKSHLKGFISLTKNISSWRDQESVLLFTYFLLEKGIEKINKCEKYCENNLLLLIISSSLSLICLTQMPLFTYTVEYLHQGMATCNSNITKCQ